MSVTVARRPTSPRGWNARGSACGGWAARAPITSITPVHIPPLQHFAAIVRNARLFHARWGRWCMDYWLGQFARAGWIDWTDAAITILRYPSPTEIAAARQPDSVLFS